MPAYLCKIPHTSGITEKTIVYTSQKKQNESKKPAENREAALNPAAKTPLG